MRSLPILHWLLFLLTLHTPQAQGAPLKTPGTQQCYVLNLIREIINELDKLPVASEVSSWDKVGKGQGRAGRCLRPTGLMGSLPLPLQDFLNSNEKRRLMVRVQPHTWVHLGGSPFTSCLGDLRHKTRLWTPNLEEFLTFATNSLGEDSKIKKNLKEIQPILPTTTSTEEPILIEKDNLGDFRVKLKEYLSAIRDSLNCKNT
ncbi:interleukin-3 [Orcinus orca]|uniref:interleukin-3 n=1 Tax=Orcinus orca TaxID=9733 RepID=UPI00144144D8|nr:interleukin-3 [Orcinus orca]